MKAFLLRALGALAALAALGASAAISCNITSPGVSSGYDPGSGSTDITQSYFTVSCTRGLASDPSTVTWSARADNGLGAGGGNNRAQRAGGGRLAYDVYREANCATRWQAGNTITGSITFVGTGTQTAQGNFWMCIASGLSPAAGTYTDTVTMTLTYNTFFTDTGTLGVSILTPATCSITTAPGNVVFNYVAFGSAVNASTTFRVNCTNTLPYSMALDATSGTVLGIAYTLGLSSSSGTGTGVNQTYTINGTAAAGQGGTCAAGTCSASQARTLVITY